MFKKIFGSGKKKSETSFLELVKQRERVAKKGKQQPPSAEQPAQEALLRHLDDKDKEDPTIRLQTAGKSIFDLACQCINGLGGRAGIRIEDLLALLGSIGGYSVILAALDHLKTQGDSLETAGMHHIGTADGKHFYFGDFPNHMLLQSEMSVLGLSLGMAKHLGGSAGFDDVNDALAHTASKVGTPEFGVPRLPEDHRPVVSPTEFVRLLWPRFSQELDRYAIQSLHRPSVIGFAIQNALQAGKDGLDLTLATKIIIECAVPTARLDPAEIQHSEN